MAPHRFLTCRSNSFQSRKKKMRQSETPRHRVLKIDRLSCATDHYIVDNHKISPAIPVCQAAGGLCPSSNSVIRHSFIASQIADKRHVERSRDVTRSDLAPWISQPAFNFPACSRVCVFFVLPVLSFLPTGDKGVTRNFASLLRRKL